MKTEKPLECPIIAGFPVNSINERGFGSIPTRVMDDVRLSMGARCLYALLAAHAGSQHEAWPSVKRIIATLGCAENSFYKYRAELSDAGYISIETRQTRYGRRTVYVIEQTVEYPVAVEPEPETEFSTNPSSEPYRKICGMGTDVPSANAEMWKTNGGKPSHTAKFEVSHTANFAVQNISTGIETKNSTTSQHEDNSLLEQCGTARAEPVVSSPTATSNLGLSLKKNEEKPLEAHSADAAFDELEARSLRRTKNKNVLAAARASYRRLVSEGHSIEDITAAYDRYLLWVEADDVKNPMGLASWLERPDGFKYNDALVKKARSKAVKNASNPPSVNSSTESDLSESEYRRISQEVSMVGSEADAEYRVAFAEQSNDEHLRHLAALIRSEKPVTLGNGMVDYRLSQRPSYVILWSRTNKKEHHRDYVLWAYERLKAERKVH